MGFGILFFGYLIAFGFSPYFFADITAIVGCVVMLFAALKLAEYNRYFTGTIISAMALILLSAGELVCAFLSVQGDGITGDVLETGVNLAACGVHIFSLLGIWGIAKGAECAKVTGTAPRNLVMSVTYYIAASAVTLTEHLYADEAQYVALWLRAYWLICFILNLVLIYRAFGLLYSADEDPNVKKRSRFKIINYMDDKMDAFEENTKKYRMESVQMALDEAEKRKAEREKAKEKNRGTKKKKKK